jgi:hypothetical protein
VRVTDSLLPQIAADFAISTTTVALLAAAICGTTGSMARTLSAELKIRKLTMLSILFMSGLGGAAVGRT